MILIHRCTDDNLEGDEDDGTGLCVLSSSSPPWVQLSTDSDLGNGGNTVIGVSMPVLDDDDDDGALGDESLSSSTGFVIVFLFFFVCLSSNFVWRY